MIDLVIVGAGGFGRELQSMLQQVFAPSEYRFKGFLGRSGDGTRLVGQPLLGDPEHYQPQASERLLLAIGGMADRVRVVEALEAKGARFVSFIHPQAHVAPTAEVGQGGVIYPMAVVSHAARLEPHVHLSYFASLGHDAEVGRYSLLAPYATLNGFCRLAPQVYVATHATVVAGCSVGAGSRISANSAAMKDVPPGSLVFGVPGRCTRYLRPAPREAR